MVSPSTPTQTSPPLLAEQLTADQLERRVELVDGELLERVAPGWNHGDAQAALTAHLRAPFHRRLGGPEGPGGWWIILEPDIVFDPHTMLRPDLAGWRRERVHEKLPPGLIHVRPDWVCEIISPSNARRDQVTKHAVYRRAGIPHYWLVDPERETLVVHRWSPDGYVVVHVAERQHTVFAEPFEAIALRVGLLFGDDPDDAGPVKLMEPVSRYGAARVTAP